MERIRLGTRGSALALRQAAIVAGALGHVVPGIDVEVRVIATEGDRRRDVSLEKAGGEGIFVKDIEQALLRDEIDAAVHSLKDMPTLIPGGLTIGAVLERGDVRDVLVSRDARRLSELPRGARVGTDSRRRAVQILALRPDLRIEGIRGNVDTRIAKVRDGDYDAVVLAAAGLDRLDRRAEASQIFDVETILPAVGQAVLAVECRTDDSDTLALIQRIRHSETATAVEGERSYLARLGAGCRLPVGALGEVASGQLRLRAVLGTGDGRLLRGEVRGPSASARELGARLADELLLGTR